GMFVIDPCERVRTNENKGGCQVGLRVTWDVGESGMVLFRYSEGAQEWCRERWVSSEKGRENLLGLLGQGVKLGTWVELAPGV
nr:hypothetical protein [Tanacetum cinerariifolium]